MNYRDAIAIAARSVTRRLGRAVLTVLAVALAAALLSSLLIAGSAARSRVLDDVSRGGPLTGIRVDAAAPDPGSLDTDNPPTGAPRILGPRLEFGAPRFFEPTRFFGSAGGGGLRARWTRMQIVGVAAQELGGGQFVVPIGVAQTARTWSLSGASARVFGGNPSP